MIRLLLLGEDELRPALESRLRGATISDGVDDPDKQPFNSFDACAWLGPGGLGNSLIENVLTQQRKHVLVSGYCWPTQTGLQALSRTANQAGLCLSVINSDHYLPSRQLIRQQLDAGKFGAPGLLRIHRWDAFDEEHNGAIASEVPVPLIRDIEMAIWLMGRQPELVYATEVDKRHAETNYQRTIQVHLGFPGGAMALIDYTNRLPAGESYQSLSLIGSSGATYADDHQNVQLLYRGEAPRAVKVDERLRCLANLMQDFVDAISTKRDCTDSIRRWEAAFAVADAIHPSINSHRAIAVEKVSP